MDMTIRLSPAHTDPVLQDVLANVHGEQPVSKADDVVDVLTQRFAGGKPDRLRIDLIAHSRRKLLLIDNWVVGDNAPTRALRDRLTRLLAGVEVELFLFGCMTAQRPQGREAMEALAAVFGARVWGTTQPISKQDFAEDAFQSPGVLVDQNGKPRVQGAQQGWLSRRAPESRLPGSAERIATLLRPETEEMLRRERELTHPAQRCPVRRLEREELHRLLIEHAKPLPILESGLLALPDVELSARLGEGQCERVIALLEGAFVRVRLQESSTPVLLEMENTSAWHEAFERLLGDRRPPTTAD